MSGWCVNGQVATSKLSGEAITYFVSAVPLSKQAGVGKDFSKLWQLENGGLDDLSWSQQDKAVIDLWERK